MARRLWKWRAGTIAAVAVILTGSACATLQVGSDYDKGASFANYHTFTIMHRDHRGTTNPLVVSRADDDIRTALESKGYRLAADPSMADFSVDFTIGSKDRTDVNTYPAPYGGPWWGGGWWGGAYWGNNIDVRQYKEGTLSIDVFDARSHRPVWHGWARKQLSRKDIEQSEEPIRRAVDAVLAKFPPR